MADTPSDNVKFTPKGKLIKAYRRDQGEFVKAFIENVVYMSSNADADNSKTVDEKELRAMLKETKTHIDEFCTSSGDREHADRFQTMMRDIKQAAGIPSNPEAAERIGTAIETTLNEQMGGLRFFFGPENGSFAPHVREALQDPAIIAASERMVTEHTPGFDPVKICDAQIKTAPHRRRER